MAIATEPLARQLALGFAALLEYPLDREEALATLHACEKLAGGESQEALDALLAFRGFALESSTAGLQEAYTLAFDLDSLSSAQPTCYPYVGHHLFEENHKRSAFLLGLRGLYREHGFPDDPADLPDHVATVLRFLATCDDVGLVAETVDEGLLPALARMRAALPDDRPDDGRRRYQGLLAGLEAALAARRPPLELDEGELEWARAGDSLGISRDTCKH